MTKLKKQEDYVESGFTYGNYHYNKHDEGYVKSAFHFVLFHI